MKVLVVDDELSMREYLEVLLVRGGYQVRCVGSVREVGVHLGLATPFTDALLGLTRLMAQTRGLL